MAYSDFKDFDKKNFILRAMLHPKIAINFESNNLEAWNFAKVCHNAYIESQKVLSVCIFVPWKCWRKYRGWCKFASALPLPPRNRVKWKLSTIDLLILIIGWYVHFLVTTWSSRAWKIHVHGSATKCPQTTCKWSIDSQDKNYRVKENQGYKEWGNQSKQSGGSKTN